MGSNGRPRSGVGGQRRLPFGAAAEMARREQRLLQDVRAHRAVPPPSGQGDGRADRDPVREPLPQPLPSVGMFGRRRDESAERVSAETPVGGEPLDDLVRAAALAFTGGAAGARHELVHRIASRWQIDAAGRAAVEELLAGAVNDAWARGFEPGELVHFVRRRVEAPAVDLLVAAIVADAERYRRRPEADPAWIAQVDALRKRSAKPGWADAWASRQGDLVDAARHLARLHASLSHLPRLDDVGGGDGGERGPFRRRGEGAGDDDIDPKVLSRVRGLLAKAESTTFPEEAEALMGKAQELMARYAIDRAVVESAAGRGSAPTSRRIRIEDPYAAAKTLLLSAVARASRCRSVWIKDLGSCAVFGFPGDVATVDLMFTSLLAQAATAMHASRPDDVEPGSLRAFRQSFIASYAGRIGERLEEATRTVVDEAVAADDSLLPVLAKRDDEVESAFREAFPSSRSYRVSVTDRAGRRAGRDAADRADLGRTASVTSAPKGALGR